MFFEERDLASFVSPPHCGTTPHRHSEPRWKGIWGEESLERVARAVLQRRARGGRFFAGGLSVQGCKVRVSSFFEGLRF